MESALEPAQAEPPTASRLPSQRELEQDIIAMLRLVFDPEIPVNIYDLGLVYELKANPDSGRVEIRMTLTAPSCPVAESLPNTVAELVRQVPGVEDVQVELVWEPPWSQQMLSEAARLELGLL